LGHADRSRETAEADEGGALGEGVEDGVESVGEGRSGTSWETGGEGEESGKNECEEELR